MLAEIRDVMAVLGHLGGYIGSCLADETDGRCIEKDAKSPFDLDTAARLNAAVVRAKRETIAALGMEDAIEDILISLTHQYHLIRPLRHDRTLFLYLVLDRAHANLPYARLALSRAEEKLQMKAAPEGP
jgi:predicted regulator of Ras-like GTPase activity (Roadblock/LC7/MglB family)